MIYDAVAEALHRGVKRNTQMLKKGHCFPPPLLRAGLFVLIASCTNKPPLGWAGSSCSVLLPALRTDFDFLAQQRGGDCPACQ